MKTGLSKMESDIIQVQIILHELQALKIGILRVNDKCAAGEPDRIGTFLKGKINTGLITVTSKVVQHISVPRKATEVKNAVRDMADNCHVVFTLGWGRIRPDTPMVATGPYIEYPSWVHDILLRKVGMFLVPDRTVFVHLRETKPWALIGLKHIAPRLAAKVDNILTGRVNPPVHFYPAYAV